MRFARSFTSCWRGESWSLLLAGSLLAASLAIPLIFDAGAVDAFALPKIRVLQGLSGVVLVLIAFRALQGPVERWRFSRAVDVAAAVFVVWNLLAFAFSIDREQSLYGHGLQHQGLLAVLMYLGSFYAARLAFGTCSRTQRLLGTVAAGGALAAAYAIAQRVGLDPIWNPRGDGRVFSTIGQPNALAAYLVLVIPVTVAVGVGVSRRWRRMAVGAVVVVLVTAVIMTLGRGGYLGLLAGGAVAAALGSRYWNRRAIAKWILPAVLMIGMLAAATGFVGSAWDSLAGTNLGRRSDHVSLWRVGIAITADHPLVGTGQETYPLIFEVYRDRVLDPATARYLSSFRPESPHNAYIATAAGAGIPALAALAALIALSLRQIWWGVRLADRSCRFLLIGIAAASCGHLVTDFFMTQEVTGSWTFWVLLGAGVEVARTVRSDAAAIREAE